MNIVIITRCVAALAVLGVGLVLLIYGARTNDGWIMLVGAGFTLIGLGAVNSTPMAAAKDEGGDSR